MYCHYCGRKQTDEEVSFCSYCGLKLDGTAGVQLPSAPAPTPPASAPRCLLSPRQRGIRQGAMLMASTLLMVPLTAILGAVMLHLPVEFVPAMAVFCFVGGFLRILYALLFQDHLVGPACGGVVHAPRSLPHFRQEAAPPVGRAAGAYTPPRAGSWRDPDIGYQPPSVTENTTRLLDKRRTEWPA